MPTPLPTLLLTAFEPFGGEAINPSWQVAEALHGQTVDGRGKAQGPARIQAWQLPCVFGAAAQELQRAIEATGPALVLALGQAGGRSDFSLERVAINVDDARIADNAGAQPVDEPVVAGGPAAYFATLPIKAMVAGLRAAGLPASVSNSAGTYVCNHVFYALMHALRARPGVPAVRGGFMHLPYLPEQVARQAAQPGAPSLPLATLVQGVHLALALAWAHRGADLRASGGTEA